MSTQLIKTVFVLKKNKLLKMISLSCLNLNSVSCQLMQILEFKLHIKILIILSQLMKVMFAT